MNRNAMRAVVRQCLKAELTPVECKMVAILCDIHGAVRAEEYIAGFVAINEELRGAALAAGAVSEGEDVT